jgi:hypothetical protein
MIPDWEISLLLLSHVVFFDQQVDHQLKLTKFSCHWSLTPSRKVRMKLGYPKARHCPAFGFLLLGVQESFNDERWHLA